MEVNTVGIVELEDPAAIGGGDDSLLIGMYGLAFAAGVVASGGLLGIAVGIGAAVALFDSVR